MSVLLTNAIPDPGFQLRPGSSWWGKLFQPRGGARRWLRYVLTGLLSNAVPWALVFGYLTVTPEVYRSEWTLILPGAGASSRVSLEDVGQASVSTTSPYGIPSISPKVSYKAITESAAVVQAAAERLDLTAVEFGKPRVKLIDQTSLMQFSVSGGTPQASQARSMALYQAFQAQLDIMRFDEMDRRERASRAMLQTFLDRLHVTRQALVEYREESQLVSNDQFQTLAENIEALRTRHAEVLAEQRKTSRHAAGLARTLGVTADLAAAAMLLQADPRFRQNLAEFSEASETLTVYLAKWGRKHPKVVAESARRDAARYAMEQRAGQLVGVDDPRLIGQLHLVDSEQRESLFGELITTQATSEGLAGEASALGEQIQAFKLRLDTLSEEAARLQELSRDYQLAEAVYTSAVARIDTGKSDPYASYPLVQMLVSPSLPVKPHSPNELFALAGGLGATLLVNLGLSMAWIRGALYRGLRKSV